MAEFPALPLWTDAYLGDTTHLTTIEHGAYLLLLFTAWRTPTYDLPDDDKILARYCRLTLGQWLRIRGTILAYWKLKGGRWYNGRLLDERDAVRRKVAQRSDAGKASALKRLHRSSTSVQRDANENPTSKATATATPKEEESILPDKPGLSKPKVIPEDFEQFWKAYPTDKNMPKKAALKQWLKLTSEKRIAATGAIPGFLRYCAENKWYRPIYADRFLSQEKFEGYAGEKVQTKDEIAATLDRRDKLLKQGKYAPSYQ